MPWGDNGKGDLLREHHNLPPFCCFVGVGDWEMEWHVWVGAKWNRDSVLFCHPGKRMLKPGEVQICMETLQIVLLHEFVRYQAV